MASIWKGNLTFGLVNIPITLLAAEEREDLKFTMVDKWDMSPIGYKKINKNTGQEVPKDAVAKAYEVAENEYVVLTDADFKRAAPERTQRIEILQFVDAAEIDPAFFDKPYYLEPAARSEKVYALLREALERTGKAGIAKVVIRAREYLCAVLPRGPALELSLLRYSHEIRDPRQLKLPPEDPKKNKINESELKMAERLIADLEAPWKPAQFKDEYRDYLLSYIERKAKLFETRPMREEEEEGAAKSKAAPSGDIMALLKASVEKAERGSKAAHR